MSVTIRLAKFGKRNAPSYRVVVSETRDKRNGRFLDTLGYFNPSKAIPEFEINKEKYEEWRKKGALVTEAVTKLIDGTYEYKKYEPTKEGPKETNKPSQEAPEKPTADNTINKKEQS